MNTSHSTLLKVIHVLFWIAFIGLCIKTGALVVSYFVSLFVNPAGAHNLYMGLDLSAVFNHSMFYYNSVMSFLIAITALKAFIAYLIVRIFLKFSLSNPFQTELSGLFMRISHVSVGTGILALLAEAFSDKIMQAGITIPIDWSGGEILFFAGVIYLLALVFKKGTELQTENDLTV